ncbi:MAG: GAF domain-containing protein, partial [Anaerolineales bacterium]|nr:GAF domain-containing protein [Anaerolineales bacterium]
AGRRQDQVVAINTLLQDSLTEQQQMIINLEVMQADLEKKIDSRTDDLNLRKRQLEAAARIARDAAAIYDLDELLDQSVRLISQRLGFYHSGIFLLDKTKRLAVLRAASSEGGEKMLAQGHRLEVGKKGIVGHVAHSGDPRIALDVGQDATYFDNPDLPKTRSELALPLIIRDEVIGVLDVQSQTPSAFSQEDVEILQILADQIALGIGTARLMSENESSLEALRQSYRELTRDVWRKSYLTRSDIHYECDADGVVRRIKVNGAGSAGYQEEDGISLDGARLSIPVRIRGEVVGSVGFEKSTQDSFWTADEISLLETLTSQLSLALDSARLFTESQRRAERERLVADITSKIRESNDPNKIVETAARELKLALQANQARYEVKEPAKADLEPQANGQES